MNYRECVVAIMQRKKMFQLSNPLTHYAVPPSLFVAPHSCCLGVLHFVIKMFKVEQITILFGCTRKFLEGNGGIFDVSDFFLMSMTI